MNADTASRSPSDGRRRGRSAKDDVSEKQAKACDAEWVGIRGRSFKPRHGLSPLTGGSSRPANGLAHFVPTIKTNHKLPKKRKIQHINEERRVTDKKSSHKIKHKKIPRVHKKRKGGQKKCQMN